MAIRLNVQDNTPVRFGIRDRIDVVAPTDYADLTDLPQINGETLIGNKTSADLHIVDGVSSVNGQTGDVTLTIPTTTSQLTNNSGFITAAQAPVQSVNGATGNVTVEVPKALSELKNDVGYITEKEAPVTSVNGKTGDVTLSIPTKTSDLQNNSGFVTSAEAANAAPVQSVNGQTGAVTLSIPTDTSDLTNTAGYVTSAEAASAAPVQSVNGDTGAVTVAENKVEQQATTTSGYSNWRSILVGYGSTGTWNAEIATNTQICRIFNNLRYQPSTGTLRTTTFYGNLTGTASGNLKSGDNVSSLSNDAGYLTLATLPIWDGGVE